MQQLIKVFCQSDPKHACLYLVGVWFQSSSLEHESREIYFIQIATEQVVRKNLTEQTLLEKKISFTCSLQQLQELIAKLRDATRLIQSLTHAR